MQLQSLHQEVAIVTGAGQGIGFEICRELARQGAKVLLNDIDPALTKKATKAISEAYGNCIGLSGDASSLPFIEEMVAKAVENYGKLTIAIANAGITVFGNFLTYSQEELNKVLQMNVGGTFFLTQAAARQMITQKSGGSILIMSSVTGHQAHKNLAAYGMSKAAIEMLARNLVLELSPFGININSIAPGATLTERTAEDPNYEKTWSGITPMGRPAYPSDIANAAVFLVSPHSRHINGQSLVIDGGWSCTSPSPY